MPKSVHYPDCFDPYLRYAIATEFKKFGSFDTTRDFWLFLLAEFTQAAAAKLFKTRMAGLKHKHIIALGPANPESRFYTIRAGKNAVLDPDTFPLWNEYVSAVELSLPLTPSARSPMLSDRSTISGQSSEKVLIGVIDDGCPFAAAQFLKVTAGPVAETRLLAIWDQDPFRPVVTVKDRGGRTCRFGKVPRDFLYGREFHRDSEKPGTFGRQIGLNEWIRLHTTPTDSIDEDSCYADAAFPRLDHRLSHGAHVMDVFAGRLPTSSRIGPSPTWSPGADAASRADVVFVQFPEACVRDSTGVWLKAYVVDAIRYIMTFADSTKLDRVVINLSYGPTTGPHDGTAKLERALSALVAEYDGTGGKPPLEIALAAGNSYLTESHVEFKARSATPSSVEWVWRLPPDNTVLCFAEIWMKDDTGVTVTLRSPSGVAAPAKTTAQTIASVGGPYPWSSGKMWRLDVGPTVADAAPSAEHGDWRITITGIPRGAEVHAYVARTDPNLGFHTGAKQSYFVDREWEKTRGAKAGCTRVNGVFDKTGSLINRHGTLNGIATAVDAKVHVAGGYIFSNRRKSRDASAGPARIGSVPQRLGPDFALPNDDSYALEGVRAGGNRSGIAFRLIGTSAAAPQLARLVADAVSPNPTTQPTDPHGLGNGNLDPP
jgi:hypothetical protein